MDLMARIINGSIPEPNSGCWLWLCGVYGSRATHRYGAISVRGKRHAAHRVAYMAMHGPIPAGAVCRHKCDVPLCVNPDHIEIGTQADNVRDMLKRQRSHHHTDPSVGVRAAKRANETMRLNPSLRPLGERNGMHGVGMPGERNGNAKLTEAKAEEIRALAGTLSQRAIARMYGVHQGVVWRIIKGQRWQARTAAALRAIAMEMSDAR